jgi:hypothetical protein
MRKRVGTPTDMWTSSAKRGCMVITLHYVDEEWEMRSVSIVFKRVLYPNTGKRLAVNFMEAVEEMSTRLLQSLWAVTADNASAISKMLGTTNKLLPDRIAYHRERNISNNAVWCSDDQIWKTNDIFLFRCPAYILQLAVQEGLKACPGTDGTVGHFRDLAKTIIDSPKLLEALVSIRAILKIKNKMLGIDYPTRWNITWEMISTIIDMKRFSSCYAASANFMTDTSGFPLVLTPGSPNI